MLRWPQEPSGCRKQLLLKICFQFFWFLNFKSLESELQKVFFPSGCIICNKDRFLPLLVCNTAFPWICLGTRRAEVLLVELCWGKTMQSPWKHHCLHDTTCSKPISTLAAHPNVEFRPKTNTKQGDMSSEVLFVFSNTSTEHNIWMNTVVYD